jgi:hypothetical protein
MDGSGSPPCRAAIPVSATSDRCTSDISVRSVRSNASVCSSSCTMPCAQLGGVKEGFRPLPTLRLRLPMLKAPPPPPLLSVEPLPPLLLASLANDLNTSVNSSDNLRATSECQMGPPLLEALPDRRTDESELADLRRSSPTPVTPTSAARPCPPQQAVSADAPPVREDRPINAAPEYASISKARAATMDSWKTSAATATD